MNTPRTALLMHISIVSVTGEIYRGDASFAALPSRSGELGILPRHAPMLSMLRPGNVRVHEQSGQVQLIYITGGMAEIRPDEIAILADVAFRTEASERQAAQDAIAVAEKAVHDGLPINDIAKAHALLQAELALLAPEFNRRGRRSR